jgi:tRNA(Ile)-lysidine synthase
VAAAGAPWPGAVAVSGGSDSLALMFLLRDWARKARLQPPVALCVDHALRAESAGDARKVLRLARAAGLQARILVRKGKAPRADIEAVAREARYRLLGEWAKQNGIKAIYVGHTRDDQAETFLLRLARGSGVDGLAAMRMVAPYPLKEFSELALVRPLLAFDREDLRKELRARNQDWLEDPMNADPHFARVKIRNVWPVLEAMGLSKERVAGAAAHLARARAALDKVSQAVQARACRFERGEALLDPAALTGAPRELGLRALAAVLMEVSEKPYRPRFERLERLFDQIGEGSPGAGHTLHGCRIGPAPAARACFGRGTLLVRQEEKRRKTMKNNG